jgi:hypothetical protein
VTRPPVQRLGVPVPAFSVPRVWTPLEQLRWEWGEAYEIERGRARRRDGLGGWIEAGTPGGLRAAIGADYARCPVPRDVGR